MSAGAERERIEAAYRRRDASAAGAAYSFANAAYVLGQQELEWALLAALRGAGVPLDGRVLDVGCGSGYYLERLRQFGAAEAVGVDLLEERVSEARRRHPGIDVRTGDATALPFEDGAFDLVTQFTMLSSILDPATRATAAREMLRVARPGGFVASVDMLPTPALRRAVRALRGTARRAGPTPVRGLAPAEVAALFGAPPAAARRFGFHLGLGPVVARSRAAALALAALPGTRTHLVAVFRVPTTSR